MKRPARKQVGGDHYEKLPIQPKDFIAANKLDFFEGSVVKYECRHREGRKDIQKAIDYLNIILENEYPESEAGE